MVADFDDKIMIGILTSDVNIQLLPASTKNQMLILGDTVPLCFNKKVLLFTF
jgi:hypothetical protein